ncbi:MAG: sigma-70 family RNA polymerase sigma factor, partial [Clostridiales bacterium]|nr:sigma-70 family RNA polymerase sigma factor [Clostridiales bacterium]
DESPNFQFQSDELTPERALTEAETRKELTEAINALPQEQKEVVVMRYSANLSYEESADILGISVGTVKSRLSRAKEKMKRFILSRT